jgi:hypothetical protein
MHRIVEDTSTLQNVELAWLTVRCQLQLGVCLFARGHNVHLHNQTRRRWVLPKAAPHKHTSNPANSRICLQLYTSSSSEKSPAAKGEYQYSEHRLASHERGFETYRSSALCWRHSSLQGACEEADARVRLSNSKRREIETKVRVFLSSLNCHGAP